MDTVCDLQRRGVLRGGLAFGITSAMANAWGAGRDGVWTNWAGNQSSEPGWRIYPRSLNDLIRALRSGPSPLRPVGGGWSTAALCPTPGTQIDLTNLRGLVSWNDSLGRARVRAGTTLADLAPMLAEVGQALPVMGDAVEPTLAGAVATSTHGSGAGLSSLSGLVTSAQLVTVGGDILEINERENSEMLPAVSCSLGVLGVVTELEIKTVPAHRLREDIASVDLVETLKNLRVIQRSNRHVELAVFAYSDTAILRRMNETTDAVSEPSAAPLTREQVVAALTRAGHNVPPLDGPLQMAVAGIFPGGSRVGASEQVLPVSAPVRYVATEYALPQENGIDALLELREAIRKADLNVMLPIQLRFVARDASWLSPYYRQDSMTLTVKQWVGADANRLFALAEPILRRYGGRPHWGMEHAMGTSDLAELYPRWGDFQALRKQLDPQGRLLNAPLKALLNA